MRADTRQWRVSEGGEDRIGKLGAAMVKEKPETLDGDVSTSPRKHLYFIGREDGYNMLPPDHSGL